MQPLDVERAPLEGTTVIEASAGTGKTYTITSLFLRLLLQSRLTVDQVLVVTYTRAATAELRDRIAKRLNIALRCASGSAVDDDPFVTTLCEQAAQRSSQAEVVKRLERALSDIDQAPILTIHSFCQRVLRDHAFESGTGFGFELTAHAGPILDEIADDYFIAQLYASDPARARLLCGEAETLRTLGVRAGAFPSVRIVPPVQEPEALSLTAWQAARQRCRELWESDRARICQLVGSGKGVNQRNFEGWCRQMDELLASGKPGFASGAFEKGFVYFTPSDVASRSKSAGAQHAFLIAAEAFRAEDLRLCNAMHQHKLAFRAGFVAYLHQELKKRAQDTEVRTFDALLGELSEVLAGGRGEELLVALRKKYRAALVDEFQDTDPAQYTIFRRIFAEGALPLFLIGDPKQAIYAFRGADVEAYLAARRDAGKRVFTLNVNRRSDEELVSALNQLYATVESPFLGADIAYLPVSVPSEARGRFLAQDQRAAIDLAVLEASGGEEAMRREIAERVAHDIAGLLASGTRISEARDGRRCTRALAGSDVAVLCRTNREAHEVQLCLSDLGIASVLSGDASVFDSEDAAHMERALLALAHPSDPRSLRSFLSSIYGGLTAPELLALEDDDSAWDAHARHFRELSELFTSRGFTQALRSLCTRYRIEERLLARPDGLRRVTNLQHLGELLSEASLTERLGPLGLLRWLETARSDASARTELTTESHELRLESGDDAVKLTTVHKSKGLEFPVVYCPFLSKAANLRANDRELPRFHDPEADGALTLDLGSEEKKAHLALAEQEALAEALRLLYVALTRAKHRICLVLPVGKFSQQSALVYTLLGGGSTEGLKALLGKNKSAAEQLAVLRAHCERSGSPYGIRELPPARTTAVAVTTSAVRSDVLESRSLKRTVDQTTRTASFSALIAGQSSVHEAVLDEPDGDDTPRLEQPSPLVLEPFPRGAGPGRLIHEVLENIAFEAEHDSWHSTAESILRARGYPLDLLEMLVTGLQDVMGTALDQQGLSLRSVTARSRINELEFLFPVTATLTSRSLAKVLRAHEAPQVLPAYARRVEALPFEALRGFLRGFIDMVFEHHGRFYIVDYKSNYLGREPADYAHDALVQAMAEHHYFLQCYLYTVALHRHLARRLPSYDYETHFGGVYYLFLRGMAPKHPHRTGVFFDRPSAALIQELDRCMQKGEAQEGAA